ncbi:hypothetical protein [Kribbella aluminosa]|uniref:hypothetical protein n=1 Tax=Kribbella aluminosa TaxID=416017 RepID=UPI0031D9F81A
MIVTSNKRDILDATRGLREAGDHGKDGVWVFDPQRVAAEELNWWWNPLSYVVDDDTARDLPSTSRTPPGRPTPAPTCSSTPPACNCSPACCSQRPAEGGRSARSSRG